MSVADHLRGDYALTEVERPGRYLGLEYNRPALRHGELKICLVFPDLYDLGISYHGFTILYHILNRMPGVRCERAYLPWKDMQEWLRRRNQPLGSVETGTPLARFDLIGITLQTEMHYPGIVKILDLAGIGRYSADRDASAPVIFGGGPAAYHPEPVAPFFDAFLLGDGEAAFPQIAETVREHRRHGKTDPSLWRALAEIVGVYVPRLYDADPEEPSRLIPIEGGAKRIKGRVVLELEPEFYPDAPLVPAVRGEHDRLTVEIMRGCSQGCRFCQAGMINRPVRERPVEDIVAQVMTGVAATGIDEVGLLSLSTSDYSGLESLLAILSDRLKHRHATLAYPSLRPSSFTEEVARINTGARRTGLTFAVEAGSERLRRVINKHLTETELLTAVERAYRNGWKTVKLYFMIGLPTETDDDLWEGSRLLQQLMKMVPRGRELHVSVAPFIPKPHTVFEREPFVPIVELDRRQRLLLHGVNRPWVKRGYHDADRSCIEALLSRGDRRLSAVIARAAELGDGFEGWGGEFSFTRWTSELDRTIPDWKGQFDGLPATAHRAWEHLSDGITAHFLKRDAALAVRELERNDCRDGECYQCGLIRFCRETSLQDRAESSIVPSPEEAATVVAALPVRTRYRVRFAKLGKARFLGHHDLQRAVERGVLRTGTPLVYTEGYSPHPRVSYSPAVPLGYGAVNMWLDFETTALIEPDEWLRNARRTFPVGVLPYAVQPVTRGEDEESLTRRYRLKVRGIITHEIEDRIRNMVRSDSTIVEYLIAPHRRSLQLELKPPQAGGLRPETVWRTVSEGILTAVLMHVTRMT